MHIRIKLLLMREIERRNQERIEAYENQRKGTFQPRKRKAKRNRGKPRKKPYRPLQRPKTTNKPPTIGGDGRGLAITRSSCCTGPC